MASRWPIDSAELASLEASEDYRRHGTLLYDIHEKSRVVSAHFDGMMKPGNLTRAEWWAFMEIVRHEGSPQSKIARRINNGRSATGKLMARLEAKGRIVREMTPAR
ncbi:MarR family regulator (plasmid) [Ketogulonicigenium robustum]|uniref:MarR family regulator n=1 Tax=Ketogulonicigenium robustum TaxID=92947 RepID=A0A1W6P3I6_9RHOB|nr:MarR family winged helix-turn-helix transcriptional regulator [Ketogulonicigenium robustum]ARO15973.1 MarR family regulator [Ketogulonicigenium robustum]